MNTADFAKRVVEAIANYFPQAKSTVEEHRGMVLRGRVEIDDTDFIDVYYSAATGKKSYALIRSGVRALGYDNFRFWHKHPKENPGEHIACEEPSADQVFREMKEMVNLKSEV